MTSFRYRPGPGLAVVHGDTIVVLGSDRRELATELWHLISSPQWSTVDLLDRLSAGGLAATPEFAVVTEGPTEVRILVRGSFTVIVEDGAREERIDGTAVSTWRETSVPASDSACVTVRAAVGGVAIRGAEEVEHPIASGVVSVAHVVAGAVESSSQSGPVGVPDRGTVPADEPEPEPVTEPEPEAEPPSADRAPDPNETLVEQDVADRFDAMFGMTVAGRRLEDAAVRDEAPSEASEPARAEPPIAAPPAGDHAGDTMSAAELARLRAERRSAPATAQPKAVPSTTRAVVELSTGKAVELDRPVIIGRSPRAHGATSAEVPHVLVVDSPYVSSTHLRIAFEDRVVVATDLSTNGTLITRPGSEPVRLDKGRASVVTDGCVLSLSDDITVTVTLTPRPESVP